MARQPNIYSNSRFSSYDGITSSLGMRFFNTLGAIDLNPINPEFIGKTPSKGDRVYDYDNKLTVYISASMAVSLRTGISKLRQYIEAEESIKSVSSRIGDKEITIFAPGQVKVRVNKEIVDTSDSFVIQVKNKDETGIHILQNETINFTTVDGEVAEDTIYSGLEMLIKFLEAVMDLNIYAGSHATTLATGGAAPRSSGSNNSAFANIVDDDDEDYEEEDVPVSNKKKSSKVTSKMLADEFDDED